MLRSRATIHKRRRESACTAALIGRRVAVPQRYTEVEDDGDGFCFGAVIVAVDARRAMLKFDYTGEREAWRVELVREWLADAGVEDLNTALSTLRTTS